MARWRIVRDADGVHLIYDNLVTGMHWPCGAVAGNVPDAMVVDWIFAHGVPAFGDRIRYSNGREFVYQQSQAQA